MTLTADFYQPQRAEEWNALVATARNATFLLDRRYMDYHSDRFADCSLMFCQGDRLVAALPACVKGDVVSCHAGLTYGPLIVSAAADHATVHECMAMACDVFRQRGARTLLYKPIPYIYIDGCADDDLYEMFRLNARLKARALSTAVCLQSPLPMRTLRARGMRKALRNGLTVNTESDVTEFWQLLRDVLTERHGVQPVHTAAEMQLLGSRFPTNIRLYTVRDGARLMGGEWVFFTPRVAHAQYIAASDEGRAKGALDLLFCHLMEHECGTQKWLDFGISTEDGGRTLNNGLLWQKEGFGGRGVCYDQYEIEL